MVRGSRAAFVPPGILSRYPLWRRTSSGPGGGEGDAASLVHVAGGASPVPLYLAVCWSQEVTASGGASAGGECLGSIVSRPSVPGCMRDR